MVDEAVAIARRYFKRQRASGRSAVSQTYGYAGEGECRGAENTGAIFQLLYFSDGDAPWAAELIDQERIVIDGIPDAEDPPSGSCLR